MEYTLPTKLMEYVALGVPSIVARTISIETYFKSNQVVFFEPENYQELASRIIELANDREAAATRAEQAYHFYDEHNWRITKQHYLQAVALPGPRYPIPVTFINTVSRKAIRRVISSALLPVLISGLLFLKLKLSLTTTTLNHAESFEQFNSALKDRPIEHSYGRTKRWLDLGLSLFMLAVLAIPMAIIAFLVRLNSPGPILFRQTRLGKDCQPFTIYKFRTMYTETSPELHKDYIRSLMRSDSREEASPDSVWLPPVKDTRVTPLGYWLRQTGLDELPQLFNVIKGEMSLVGPRPPLNYEVELYQDWQLTRMLVLPGITGLWQVSSRGKASFDEMVRLDIDYIQRQSLALDLWIILVTIPSRLIGSINYRR
jgi:lipopolysaccharide/colanic/teichoic acid biosynthesis glycosyltransferase